MWPMRDKGEVIYIERETALEKGEENSNKEKRKNQSPAL